MRRNPCPCGGPRAGSTRKTRAGGSSGIAATMRGGAARTTCARSAAGKRFGATSRRSASIASRATCVAGAGSARRFSTGPTTRARYDRGARCRLGTPRDCHPGMPPLDPPPSVIELRLPSPTMSPNSSDDVAVWHRRFASECNNRAWQLAEAASRTAAEDAEMLDAAHAAALHWRAVGTELHAARATMLLAQVHALLGHGALALPYARASFAFVTSHESADWEVAFAHAILANAAA